MQDREKMEILEHIFFRSWVGVEIRSDASVLIAAHLKILYEIVFP